MAELLIIRHAQASFGAANYDALSELGHRQAELAGALLRARGWAPDRIVTGALTRQAQTLQAMGFAQAELHAGLDEYDFADLLRARFAGGVPAEVTGDRRSHFRALRETLREWQAGGLRDARESWSEFRDRVAAARAALTAPGARRVLAISSGGPIGQMVAAALGAPDEAMIALNLQVKNTSLTRFVFNERAFWLHAFNETPHLDGPEAAGMLTYS